jgi:hypothetical protein
VAKIPAAFRAGAKDFAPRVFPAAGDGRCASYRWISSLEIIPHKIYAEEDFIPAGDV